ncbi:MAG: helix-turn-helix domain-containing protein [Candidatus Nanopelagicales bacterium]
MGDTPRGDNSRLAQALAATVSRLRHERAWTLEELADRSGLHRTHLGLVERGERGLTIDSADQVAQALGLPLSELVAMAEVAVAEGGHGEAS